MRVQIRPMVAADLPHLIGIALPHRIQAVTALVDGRIVGAGGIGFRPDGAVIAFAIVLDEGRKYPAAIWRAGRAVMEIIRRSRAAVVIAEAEEHNAAAIPFMLRLGFRPFGDVFVWERRRDAA